MRGPKHCSGTPHISCARTPSTAKRQRHITTTARRGAKSRRPCTALSCYETRIRETLRHMALSPFTSSSRFISCGRAATTQHGTQRQHATVAPTCNALHQHNADSHLAHTTIHTGERTIDNKEVLTHSIILVLQIKRLAIPPGDTDLNVRIDDHRAATTMVMQKRVASFFCASPCIDEIIFTKSSHMYAADRTTLRMRHDIAKSNITN